MKKKLFFLLKLCISFLLALAILCVFCLVYYNPPVAIPQPDGYTNHRFTSGAYWANMTEGAGWGTINNIGYNSYADYNPETPTIAFIGSSQVEAQQVPQNLNFVSTTNELFLSDEISNNDYQCINLGISGHFLNVSVSNFEYFAEYFDGIDYAVLEVSNIYYSNEEIERILSGDYHSDLKPRNFIYQTAQKIPFFRLLVKQLQDLQNGKNSELAPNASATSIDYVAYQQGINRVIEHIASIAKEHNIQLVILYHHPLMLNSDNTATTGNDPKTEAIFIDCCNNNNVPNINMNQVMIEHFESTYEPSYGFANTVPGEGHLNEVGHRLIAQEVYAKINELMEEK